MEKLTIIFTYEKETKNTVRFKEDNDPPYVGALYVQKWAFKDGVPSTLKVTVEEN